MLAEMGPPQVTVWEYPGADHSWDFEFDSFIEAINNGKPLNGDIHDAYEALKIVDKIYVSGGRGWK
jgi:predicted dehydrogenase